MHIRRCVVLAAISALPIASLQAQRPIFVALAGGVSLPSADLSDGTKTGWNAQATLGVSTLMQPIGLRLDVAYNQFGFDNPAAAGENINIGSATLNATYRLPMTNSPLSPYLITGLGAYRTDCSSPACESTTHFGWNAGLGTKLNVIGFVTFLEARYHRTSSNGATFAYVPITFGVTF